MPPQIREQIRLSLLRHLDAASGSQYGLSNILLLAMLRSEGFSRLTDEQLAAELAYLEDKEFIFPPAKPISPEVKTWRITADGRDFWAEQEN